MFSLDVCMTFKMVLAGVWVVTHKTSLTASKTPVRKLQQAQDHLLGPITEAYSSEKVTLNRHLKTKF